MVTPYERITDIHRSQALEALGFHYAQGRLPLEEYERRADRALGCQTDMEMRTIFMDLPIPHYDRGIELIRQHQVPVSEPTPQVVAEYDPWDRPIGHSQLTPRKLRKMGWIIAIFWIIAIGPIAEAILPGAMAPFVMLTPILFMVIASIAMAPNRPKRQKVYMGTYDRGPYPY